MTLTETVIREQFDYWKAAMDAPLPDLPGKMTVVTGCGTSFYLAQSIAAALNISGRQAVAVPGAEWARRMGNYVASTDGVSVIGLSRSGTTTETLQALEASSRAGLPTLAITCEPGSPIVKAADQAIAMETHPKEGIVMTVSASLMLAAGLRLAGVALPMTTTAEAALRKIEAATPLIAGRSHFVCLGGAALYGVANEGALKLMEMSISLSQAFHPMEYRHGPTSLIDASSLVVMLYSEDTAAEEEKLSREIQAKGGAVIGFGGPGDLSIPLATSGPARGLEVLPALQLLGERVAGLKGIDTVSPRHLTKVVVL